MKLVGILIMIMLVIMVIPAEAKEPKKTAKDRAEERAVNLERQINQLISSCKFANDPYDFQDCHDSGQTLKSNHLFKFVNPSTQMVLKTKLHSWAAKS